MEDQQINVASLYSNYELLKEELERTIEQRDNFEKAVKLLAFDFKATQTQNINLRAALHKLEGEYLDLEIENSELRKGKRYV